MGTKTDTIAITDIDDLVALPVGVKIQDKDGDVYQKTDQDTYISPLYEFPAIYLIDYLPGVVLTEPVEIGVGDEVRVLTDQFKGALIHQGDLGKVVEIEGQDGLVFYRVRFGDNLHMPLRYDELELVRRNIEAARKTSDGIIDRIVASFRSLLDKLPNKPVEVEEHIITSVAELNALPSGSVVTATVVTAAPTRYKDAGGWRVHGEPGYFNYTTAKLAALGKLRLAYVPE